jgi:SAM-dependent methyltransferase
MEPYMTDDAFSDVVGREPPAEIDITVPHSARIWNYWLGGKDNYPVDQEAGDQFREVYPQIVDAARQSRYFLARAVRYLAGEAGIRQFLDVGTGLPTVDNTHEVAQRVAPDSRIVYVDNDPLVLAHARALLTSTPEGATDYIDADMRDPGTIVRRAARTLNFDRPIALIFSGVLGHIGDDNEAFSIVHRLLAPLRPGGFLVASDGTNVVSEDASARQVTEDPAHAEAIKRYNESGAVPYHLRTPDRVARFFDGLELVEPGLVSYSDWRPDSPLFESPPVQGLCGVGRKT